MFSDSFCTSEACDRIARLYCMQCVHHFSSDKRRSHNCINITLHRFTTPALTTTYITGIKSLIQPCIGIKGLFYSPAFTMPFYPHNYLLVRHFLLYTKVSF